MRRIDVDTNTLMSAPIELFKIGRDPAETAGFVAGERVLCVEEGEVEVEGTLLVEDGYWMIQPDWDTARDRYVAPAETDPATP